MENSHYAVSSVVGGPHATITSAIGGERPGAIKFSDSDRLIPWTYRQLKFYLNINITGFVLTLVIESVLSVFFRNLVYNSTHQGDVKQLFLFCQQWSPLRSLLSVRTYKRFKCKSQHYSTNLTSDRIMVMTHFKLFRTTTNSKFNFVTIFATVFVSAVFQTFKDFSRFETNLYVKKETSRLNFQMLLNLCFWFVLV